MSASRHARVLALLILFAGGAGTGCGRRESPRQAASVEQALHGHWSSTRELLLPAGAQPWDTAGATAEDRVEIDRYIDATPASRAWSEQAGDATWRPLSEDATEGAITVEIRPLANPDKPTTTVLRLDPDRRRLLEPLPPRNGRARVRVLDYVNEQARP